MELTEKLKNLSRVSTKKRVDVRLVFLLGLFGVFVVMAALWLAISDQRDVGEVSEARQEGRQAVESLVQSVESLKRVLVDDQVQALAARAVENPDTVEDLASYLTGRNGNIQEVMVFPSDLSATYPEDLGPNGFALLDMILSAKEGKKNLMQIHYVLEPPRLYDAVTINSGDEELGVLIVALDPESVLSGFNPDYASIGYIGLSQYNGRATASRIREWGDARLLGEVPDRIPVPGTQFRIEIPLQTLVVRLGAGTVILMLITGLACLAGSVFLFLGNRKWREARELESEKSASSVVDFPRSAEPGDVSFIDDAEPEEPNAPAAIAKADDHASVEGPVSDEEEQEAEADSGQPAPPLMRLHYDFAERRKLKEAKHVPVELSPEIFRAYDIRGVIDKTLDSGVARNVGQAVGTLALERNAGPVVVARDGRLSGPYLMEGMIAGIVSSGCDVLDIGAVPTGVLYYAAHELAAGSGVVITGSHNPPDYNGFKIMIGGDTLHGDAIKNIYERIRTRDLRIGEGEVTRKNVVPDYIKRVADDISVDRDLKVVIDCGNGIGGVCAADTLRAIGVEVLPLFDEVDGTFPNHHPDPSEPENLQDLIESVRLMDADLGLAFDGDADRLGVVTLAGNIIYPDRVMMLLALDVLDRIPGATIIYDVKCTQHLPKLIKEAGGNPVMYKTGHSLIKAYMKEIGSPFAGEMSGHFFFGERWYGVDDGIYAAARLLEILGGTETPPEAILNALPSSFSTPELKVQMQEGENHAFVEAFREAAHFDGARINKIDGIRADFDDGWGLVRASNTTPILVVRFDADTEEALVRIKASFRSQMLELNPDLELPF
jgi:phosphomannomutase/phosphoglucomutase